MRTFSPPQRPHPSFFPGEEKQRALAAFTLIEVLVTMLILLLILVTLLGFISNVEQAWRSTAVDPFAEAQDAFETIVNRVTNATLDPYEDYADSSGAFRTSSLPSFVPDHLARRSDLAFVCGPSSEWLAGSGRTTATDCVFFIAPTGYTQTEAHLGLERLLNSLGYFVEFGDETNRPAFILPGTHRWRWRLKQIVQPSESLGIYTQTLTSLPWVQALVQSSAPVSDLAENVVALIVMPDRAANDPVVSQPIAPNFQYDSRDASNALTRHQLPPRLLVALAVIDESSAAILASKNGSQAPALVPASLFTSSTQVKSDLATLDTDLTAEKIKHRILQREILLPAAEWTSALSQ